MKQLHDTELIHILEWPRKMENVTAFNTLRGHTEESDPYSGFNLCDYTADSAAHVDKCRDTLCAALGIGRECLVMPRQTHTCRVAAVDEALMSLSAAERMAQLQDVDALVTRLSGVCIGVNTADCVNISLADAEAGVIGVAHAGWRGTAGRIAARTVDAMERLGAARSRIMAVMGASICQDCFEVGEEVLTQFAAQGFDTDAICRRSATTGKPHIHLQEANRLTLLKAGLKAEHIVWNGECSRCSPSLYFSARRLGISSGRTFTGVIKSPRKPQ